MRVLSSSHCEKPVSYTHLERAVAIIVGLPILRINILGGGDGILRTGHRADFIHKIAVLGLSGHPRYMEVYFQLQEVLGIASVYESQILRQDLIEDETSQSGLYRTGNGLALV